MTADVEKAFDTIVDYLRKVAERESTKRIGADLQCGICEWPGPAGAVECAATDSMTITIRINGGAGESRLLATPVVGAGID